MADGDEGEERDGIGSGGLLVGMYVVAGIHMNEMGEW